jgi:putative hemolysin
MAERGDRGAIAAEKILSGGRTLKASLVTCSLLTDAAALLVMFVIAAPDFRPGLAFAGICALELAKAAARALASRWADEAAIRVAAPFRVMRMPFWPASAAVAFAFKIIGKEGGAPPITENELKKLVFVSREEGIIEESEREMINNVFDFQDNDATDVMTPRTEIVALPESAGYGAVMETFRDRPYSRIPIYRDNMDHIVGILHLRDFFLSGAGPDDFDMKKTLRPAFFSYETKSTSKLFAEMRTNGIALAVILDEYGGTLGLVSVHDLIEEIVGDINDEYGGSDSVEINRVGDGEFIVEGSARIDDFNEAAGTRLESDEYDSVAGYVMGLLGEIPSPGDKIDSGRGAAFVIEKMDRNRILSIRALIDKAAP